jgi:hypothetical protein
MPRKKSPVTRPGIDTGTFRLVAQRLNHYATPGPLWIRSTAELSYTIRDMLSGITKEMANYIRYFSTAIPSNYLLMLSIHHFFIFQIIILQNFLSKYYATLVSIKRPIETLAAYCSLLSYSVLFEPYESKRSSVSNVHICPLNSSCSVPNLSVVTFPALIIMMIWRYILW